MPLFLRGQKLFRLKPGLSDEDRKAHVCGSGFDEKAWGFAPRDALQVSLLGENPPHRVVLLCDAGVGKTTNMEWLRYQLAERRGWQLPLLLRLEDMKDRALLEKESSLGQKSEALVLRFAKLIENATDAAPDRLIPALLGRGGWE